MLEPVGVHLEAVGRVDLLDEGGHAELAKLVQLVLFAESNQLFGDIVNADAVSVQVLDQRPDSSGCRVQGDAKCLGTLRRELAIQKNVAFFWLFYQLVISPVFPEVRTSFRTLQIWSTR